LTITANSTSKPYGQTLTFAGTEFTTSGLIAGDTVTSATISSTGAANTAPAGSYPITISNAVGTGLGNYTINYVNGTLTINSLTLTITANSTSKTYGQTVTLAGTEFTTSGLVNGNTVTSVTLTSAGAAATATVAGSPYSIVPSAALGTGLSNYTINYVNGSLTVNKAPLTITANSTSKTYGQTLTFVGTEFTTSGLLNSDTVTSVTLTSAGAAATAPAGSPYSIVPSNAVGTGLGNYTINYVSGGLNVLNATLTITANSTSKTYGQTVTFAGTEFTTSGLVNGNTVTSVTLTSAGAPASAAVAGSPYSIVPSAAVGTGLGNYTISYVNGSLTVTAAATTTTLVVSPNPATSGNPVTFTATIAPVAPGSGSPTGTVQFQVDGTNDGAPVTVNNGVATFSDSTVAIGDHTIKAIYTNTDGNFLNSNNTAPLSIIGGAGVGGIIINDGSNQHSMVDSFTVNFTTTVTLDPGAVQVYEYPNATNPSGGYVGLMLSTSTVISGGVPVTQLVITFTGGDVYGDSLADGNYRVIVHSSGVHFTNGQPTPPIDFNYITWRLFGDVVGNRNVHNNATDMAAMQNAYVPGTLQFQGVPGSHYIWYLDYDNKGWIDSGDYYQFLRRYNGPALPPPP
jgi:hypothetical protein